VRRSAKQPLVGPPEATHRVNLGRILPALGHVSIDTIAPEDVAALVVGLSGLKRESIRKTIATLAMVFDFHGVMPNPARDNKRVKLPREDKIEVNPPTAAQVLAVHGTLPTAYRLPLLVLDATGMRVSELEQLAWGDVDEQEGRWRVSQAKAKTKQARWVPVPEIVFEAVVDTVRGRTGRSTGKCSPASAPTGSARRSRGRARRRGCRCSPRTTCATVAHPYGTSIRGRTAPRSLRLPRGSVIRRRSTSAPTPTS